MARRDRYCSSRKLIIFLIITFFLLAAVSVYLFFSKPLYVREFEVYFIVDSSVDAGFDLSTDALRFGSVGPGGGVTRSVNVTNDYTFPLRVEVSLSRNLIGLIDVDNGFVVYPRESKLIPIKLKVPKDFEEGNYTGKIRFKMHKVD